MPRPLRRCLASAAIVLLALPSAVGAATEQEADRTVTDRSQPIRPVDVDHDPGGDDADGLRTRDQRVDLSTGESTVPLVGEPELVIIDDLEPGAEVELRSRNDGVWTEWLHIHTENDDRPDGVPGGEGATTPDSAAVGPVWLGHGADSLQIRSEGHRPEEGAEVSVESIELLDTPSVADSGPRGFRAGALAAPFIRSRSSWATSDMGWKCSSGPSTGDVKAMVVHHTATGNTYGQADVPGILRAIWHYHVDNRGWCDVAYNFFVDQFGVVWEGRQGGVTKEVIGGHTFGFNTNTSGVSQVGNFESGGAPWAMTASTERLVGWKLALHGVDPKGRAVLTNRATTSTTRGLPPGGSVNVAAVVGHRDLGSTSCPGWNTYLQMDRIRANAGTGAHVFALHRTYLRAVPTHGEYAQWAALAFGSGIGSVAREMVRSEQYAGMFIRDLYQRVLGRAPDEDGLRYWLNALRTGTTLETAAISFYGSQEHYESFASAEHYIDSLYLNLLHRPADPSGRIYWSTVLFLGGTPADVATGFYRSIESRRDRVTRLYRTLLGRSPDPEGRDYWADVLLRQDDLVLSTFLTDSAEYYSRQFG